MYGQFGHLGHVTQMPLPLGSTKFSLNLPSGFGLSIVDDDDDGRTMDGRRINGIL